jgi:hypothetical protein
MCGDCIHAGSHTTCVSVFIGKETIVSNGNFGDALYEFDDAITDDTKVIV